MSPAAWGLRHSQQARFRSRESRCSPLLRVGSSSEGLASSKDETTEGKKWKSFIEVICPCDVLASVDTGEHEIVI